VPQRSSALDRSAAAVRAGVGAFADLGLSSAAVRRAADDVGVSSAYLFRLFGSQRDYFLACLDHVEERMLATLAGAAVVPDEDALGPLGGAFRQFAADGSVSGLWLQACAVARDDAEIARRCRQIMAGGLAAAAATGAPRERLGEFLARGALVMTLQAVGADLRVGSEGAVAALLREFVDEPGTPGAAVEDSA
jgi:hypothetical protein